MRNPEELHEREYYFDEGFGVSIDDHVRELKKNIPNICVEMRRDRDGFAIVKTKIKRTYKYNIDDLFMLAGQDST